MQKISKTRVQQSEINLFVQSGVVVISILLPTLVQYNYQVYETVRTLRVLKFPLLCAAINREYMSYINTNHAHQGVARSPSASSLPSGKTWRKRRDNSLCCPPIVHLSRPRSQPALVYLCVSGSGDKGKVFIHSMNSLRCCVHVVNGEIEPCPLPAASKHTYQCIIHYWDGYPVKFTCFMDCWHS